MAADKITFEIQGQEELMQTIDRMVQGMKPDKVEPIYQRGAQILAREVRKNAPVGPDKYVRGRLVPGGTLKKNVKQKKLRRFGPSSPAPTIVAIDRKHAAHAWLVTHGTSGVRPVSPPKRVVIGGQPAIITQTGRMPPNPYFGRSISAKANDVLNYVASGVGANLDDAMR